MPLVGTEILFVNAVDAAGRPAATLEQTTTSAIAALAAATVLPPIVNTAISTVGAGTLTAAGLVGGLITRTGPVAAFSDATDTAVAIVAALAAYVANESQIVRIKNTTAYAQTITAGAGVTLSGNVIIPANSVGEYLMTITSATAVTILHVDTVARTTFTPEVITTLSTVGAGTITAAGIAGKVTNRTGSQSGTPFTDTTDTATNIVAATPNIHIGDSFEYTYQNTTNAVATLAGGTGVTVSGITAIAAGGSARYLLTYTATNTFTMVGFSSGQALAASQQNITLAGSSSGTTLVKAAAAASGTITVPAATDTLVGKATTDTLTNKTITDFIDTGDTVPSALMNIVSTTTLANVPGLSVAVTAAGTYSFRAFLQGTSTTNGGLKVAIANSGTTTSGTYTGKQFNGATTNAAATTSTMGTAVAAATTVYTDATLEGVIVIANAGNLTVQAAQNAAHADTTTVTVGSYFKVSRIS